MTARRSRRKERRASKTYELRPRRAESLERYGGVPSRPPPGEHHSPTSPKTAGGGLIAEPAAKSFQTRPTLQEITKHLPGRNRILPFLPRSGGEGPGERGPLGRQFDLCRRASRSAGTLSLTTQQFTRERSHGRPH